MAFENYDAFGGQETDEERKRRLEQEALAQSQPTAEAPVAQSQPTAEAPVSPVSPDQVQQQNVQMEEQRAQREAQARALQQQAAQQQPAQAPQPEQQPVSQFSPGYDQQGPGMRMPPQQAEPGKIDLHTAAQKYQEIQNDPLKLLQFGTHDQVPSFLQDRARGRAADIINEQRDKQQAQQQLQTMSPTDLATALKQRTSGGSWLKAIAFGMLGMEQSAKEEAAKLGLGTDTYTQINGQPAIVKMSNNGTPINGYNAQTGKALTPEELVTAAQYGSTIKGAETHTGKMQDVTTGEVYYERTTPQGIQLVDNNGKIYRGASSNLRPFGIGSDINTKNTIQLNKLQNDLAFAGPKASIKEREAVIARNEAEYGPLPEEYKQKVRAGVPIVTGTAQNTNPPVGAPAQPSASGALPWQGNPADLVKQALTITDPTDRQGAINSLVKQYGPDAVKQLVAQATQPQQAQRPMAPVNPQAATAAPAPASVAAPVAPGATIAQREDQRKLALANQEAEIRKRVALEEAAKKPALEEASKITAQAGAVANTIDSIDHSLDILASNKHNIGPMVAGTLGGGGPIGQSIGTQFNTTGARNTTEVMDTIRNIGGAIAQGTIKGHLTNQELSFLTDYKPTASSDPEYVRYWLTKAKQVLMNNQKYAQEQVGTTGNANNPATNRPVANAIPGTAENPIKLH